MVKIAYLRYCIQYKCNNNNNDNNNNDNNNNHNDSLVS